MDFNEAKNRVEQLTKELNYHNDRYYNQDSPEISDYEYDMMLRELENIETEFPQLITAQSPTQKVGGQKGEKFSPVVHEVVMESLHDSFSEEEVRDLTTQTTVMESQIAELEQRAFATPTITSTSGNILKILLRFILLLLQLGLPTNPFIMEGREGENGKNRKEYGEDMLAGKSIGVNSTTSVEMILKDQRDRYKRRVDELEVG